MDLTATQLTKWAKEHFQQKGCRINRVNNIPVRRRKGTIEKGWADLQGYTSTGRYIAIEIKKLGDTIKIDQTLRLRDVITCGGLAYICTEYEGKPKIIPFQEFESKE